MTTIKIRNKEWFKEHCCFSIYVDFSGNSLIPKGTLWKRLDKKADVVHWFTGGAMSLLAGKELKVTRTDKKVSASKMNSSKYFAGGYWIPNWVIEWVKED